MSYQAAPPGSCSLRKPRNRLTPGLAEGEEMEGKEEVIVDAVEERDKPAS